jgi:hypothetical protein
VLENKDLFLLPGLFGTIAVTGSLPHRGILVPDEAIGTDQDRRIVWVLAEDGAVNSTVVRPGPRIDGYRLIRSGLTGDETIVVAGLQRVRPGAKVTPQRQELPPVGSSSDPPGPLEHDPMRFAHFFVDRPIFASVLSILLVLVGYVAYARLPVAQYPEIAPPTITVRANYPGANAETVAATVATPIEQEINGVEGMLYMSSFSTGDGNMQLTITFQPGTNLDQANVLVQNRVATAQPRLPVEVRALG